MINFDEFDIEEKYNKFCDDKEFIKFLKRHNAYDKFINNLEMEMSTGGYYYGRDWFSLETFCSDIRNNIYEGRDAYTTHCFSWGKSPEGNKYWRHISNEWYFRTM